MSAQSDRSSFGIHLAGHSPVGLACALTVLHAYHLLVSHPDATEKGGQTVTRNQHAHLLAISRLLSCSSPLVPLHHSVALLSIISLTARLQPCLLTGLGTLH
jgi:hypothetical protein